MKRVSEKCKRALSAILAAAMVLTSAPGTAMTVSAAEQTEMIEEAADGETVAVEDAGILDSDRMAAQEGEAEPGDDQEVSEGAGDESIPGADGADVGEQETGRTASEETAEGDMTALAAPVFTMNPSDGRVEYGGAASFTLSVSENSVAKYVICEADKEIADDSVSSEGTVYAGEAVTVPAPESEDETKIVVKAVAVPNEDSAATYTNSPVARTEFTFAAKPAAEKPAAPTITLTSGEIDLGAAPQVDFGTEVTMAITGEGEASIYYTTDGTDPTTDSTEYKEAVILRSDKEEGEKITIKAIAVAADQSSDVAEETVEFGAKEDMPEIPAAVLLEGNLAAFDIKVTRTADKTPLEFVDGRITVVKDTELSVEITAKEKCSLKKVTAGDTEQKIKNNKAAFKIKPAVDTTIHVKAVENYRSTTVRDADRREVKPVKKVYSVAPGEEYTITAKKGVDTDLVMALPVIKINKVEYTGTDSSVSVSEDNKQITLKIGKDLAGKTFTIDIWGDLGNNRESFVQMDTLSFKAAPILTSVTVAGVKDGVLTQAMGESKTYALTLNPKSSADAIEVRYEDEKDVIGTVYAENGKLFVTTGWKTGEARVTLYNKLLLAGMDDSEESLEKAYLGSFTLKVEDPAWTKNALKVKYVNSTDTEIAVSATMPAGIKASHNTYYIFTVEDASSVSENTVPEPNVVQQAVDGTGTYMFQVIDAEPGEGGAKKFNIGAYFVRVDDGKAPKDITSDNIVAYTKKPVAVVCSTKEPYYADKISLKKGTTTVYSGQSGVQIATIDFGKKTTYIRNATAKLLVTDRSMGMRPEYIQAEVVGERVYVNVDKNMAPGKYTIQVSAATRQGAKPATANIVITVVAGLHPFTLALSSENIYMGGNKPGKAKIDIDYDNYNAFFKPKNAKVIYGVGAREWAGGDFEQNERALVDSKNKPAVTVKNGIVTVSKDYKIKENPEENKFAVMVTVQNSVGDCYSKIADFQIVNTGQEFEKLIIVKPQITTYDLVLDTNKDSFEANKLQGAQVLVVKKGATPGEDGKYGDDAFLSRDQYTLTVKGKGITVGEWGNINVSNCTAKNVSFTATVKDGSENKVSLSIKELKYNDTKACVAWLPMRDTDWVKMEEGVENNLSFTLGGDTCYIQSGNAFDISLMSEDEKGNLGEGSKFMNYSIAVSGNIKVLADYGEDSDWLNKNQWLHVVMTGETAKVTLKQGKTVIKTYTLKNSRYQQEITAPAIKLAKGQKDLIVGKRDQALVFDVDDSRCETKLTAETQFLLVTQDKKSEYFFSDGGRIYVALDRQNIKYDPAAKKLTVPVKGVHCAGSGTISIVAGIPGEDEEWTNSRISNGVKIKAVDLKKSFTMTKQYTMSLLDASSVDLQYKGSGVEQMEIVDLYSENMGGKISRFSDAFEVGEDGKSLVLKPQNEDLAGQRVSGYIGVGVTFEDGERMYYEYKVTVNVLKKDKTANKYTASIAKLVSGRTTADEAQNMIVTINAGKNKPAPTVSAVAYKVYDTSGKEVPITTKYTADGKIALDLTNYIAANPGGKTQNVVIKVLFDNAYNKPAGLDDGGTLDQSVIMDGTDAYTALQVKVSVPKNMKYGN